jgi:peptidoglycan/xylan/chitin deacetylase (PgdA/CDA1 family)
MDKRRRPNPPLRIAVLATVLVVFVSMMVAMASSSAHTEIVRPSVEVSNLANTMALDIAGSDALYVSQKEQEDALKRIVKSKQPLFCAGTKKYATLTFDDGPSAVTTELIALLKKEGLPATWFDLGSNANEFPDKLKLQGDYGPIGNHSWDHPDLRNLSNAEIAQQIDSTQETVKAATGQDWKMMRPPYGARNAQTQRKINKMGYAEMLWSADSQDALGKDWQTIAKNTIDGIGPGAVLLFHDRPAATLEAFKKKIIPAIRKSDLTWVTLPQLLVLNPPSTEQLNRGAAGCSHAGRVNVSGYFTNPEAGY